MTVEVVKYSSNIIREPHRQAYMIFTGKIEKSLRTPIRKNPLFTKNETMGCSLNVSERGSPITSSPRSPKIAQNTSSLRRASLDSVPSKCELCYDNTGECPMKLSLDKNNLHFKIFKTDSITNLKVIPRTNENEVTIPELPKKQVKFDNFRDVRYVENRPSLFENTNKSEIWYDEVEYMHIKNSAIIELNFFKLRYPELADDKFLIKRAFSGTDYAEYENNIIVNSATTFSRNNIVKKFRNNI
jgi:hypothetical protein